VVIRDVIRGRIGFEGLLMSDDIGMHALSGSFDERARGVLEAGCDLALHCSGEMSEMVAVASGASAMTEAARDRLTRAMATATQPRAELALDEALAKRDALLAYA
jgi:beta-N-acetylhexosaminidase